MTLVYNAALVWLLQVLKNSFKGMLKVILYSADTIMKEKQLANLLQFITTFSMLHTKIKNGALQCLIESRVSCF